MPDYKIDLTGEVYGRWTVLSFSHRVAKQNYWNCICECGTERAVNAPELRRGGSRSCGCLMIELAGERQKTHGMHKHPAYSSWTNARSRCRSPTDTNYHLYGGRGITFSKKWDDFAVFWAEMGPTWKPGLSLDRIDSRKGYKPGNCRWATPMEQANNRSTNRMVKTPNGLMTATEAARFYGIPENTVRSRIKYGWSDARLGETVIPRLITKRS